MHTIFNYFFCTTGSQDCRESSCSCPCIWCACPEKSG